MSELLKTRAIVLRKINYGDTSKIAQFYTEDFGKISAIVKGARSPKSKIGMIVDTFNHLQIILYKKETREVQLVSDVDLLQHYVVIKEDYDRIKYASAILELLANLTVEHDHNSRLYKGTIRALELLNTTGKDPMIYFAKYFIFFIKEIGYEFPVDHCSICRNELFADSQVSYNFETGVLCNECRKERLTHLDFNEELFNLLICLSKKKNDINYKSNDLTKIIMMMEKFLKYNIHEFKGLKSLELS